MSSGSHRHLVSNQQWLSAAPADFAKFAAVLRRSTSRSHSPEKELAQMLPVASVELESIPPIAVEWDPVTTLFHCWEGHVMTEKASLDPPLYDDGYTCDFCGRVVAAPESEQDGDGGASSRGTTPFLHCTTCEKDVCWSCKEEVQQTPRFHRQCYRCRLCGAFVSKDATEPHRCGSYHHGDFSSVEPADRIVGGGTPSVSRAGATAAATVASRESLSLSRSITLVSTPPAVNGQLGEEHNTVEASPGVKGHIVQTRKRARESERVAALLAQEDAPLEVPPPFSAAALGATPTYAGVTTGTVTVKAKRLPVGITPRGLRELCFAEGMQVPAVDYDADRHEATLVFLNQFDGDAFVEQVQGRAIDGVVPTWSWTLGGSP